MRIDDIPLTGEIQQLIQRLNRGDDAEQAGAERSFRQMGPQQLRAFLPLLEERKQKTSLFLKRVALFSFLLPFAGALLFYVPLIEGMTTNLPDFVDPPSPPTFGEALLEGALGGLFWGIIGLALGVLTAGIYRVWVERKARREGIYLSPSARKRALAALGQVEKSHVIGALIDTLAPGPLPSARIREAIETALTRLLPNLKEEDILLLKEERQAQLCAALRKETTSAHDAAFKIAILNTITQHGTRRVLPEVERVAKGPAKTDPEREVVAAASSCLAILREREEGQRASQTLLRGSTGDTLSTSHALLRPAAGGSETEAQQLLRAEDADESTA